MDFGVDADADDDADGQLELLLVPVGDLTTSGGALADQPPEATVLHVTKSPMKMTMTNKTTMTKTMRTMNMPSSSRLMAAAGAHAELELQMLRQLLLVEAAQKRCLVAELLRLHFASVALLLVQMQGLAKRISNWLVYVVVVRSHRSGCIPKVLRLYENSPALLAPVI